MRRTALSTTLKSSALERSCPVLEGYLLRQPGGRHACLYGTNFDKGSPGANAIIAGQPFSDASKCNKVVTPNGLESIRSA